MTCRPSAPAATQLPSGATATAVTLPSSPCRSAGAACAAACPPAAATAAPSCRASRSPATCTRHRRRCARWAPCACPDRCAGWAIMEDPAVRQALGLGLPGLGQHLNRADRSRGRLCADWKGRGCARRDRQCPAADRRPRLTPGPAAEPAEPCRYSWGAQAFPQGPQWAARAVRAVAVRAGAGSRTAALADRPWQLWRTRKPARRRALAGAPPPRPSRAFPV